MSGHGCLELVAWLAMSKKEVLFEEGHETRFSPRFFSETALWEGRQRAPDVRAWMP